VTYKVSLDTLDKVNKLREAINEFKKCAKDNVDNKLLPDLNGFNEYLNNLSLLQESALLQLMIFLVLLFTVLNILALLFGIELIKYFNIENRFPFIAKFIKLRYTLQRYYLMWNVFILFVFCIVGILVNILVIW
jgi:hypothetical protein